MNQIDKAIKILNDGGIIIFPTDTAFGIGCRIDNRKAVYRLFNLRRRPRTQAAPVLVSSTKMAEDYLQSPLPDIVRQLMEDYWPGALTIVYPCKKEKVLSPVRGCGPNLGVRMPDHQAALSIIRSIGVPILGPSANFHAQKTPYKIEDLDPELVKSVDMVVGGKCKKNNVSTVIDCSSGPWKILRQGAVNVK